MSSFFSPQNPGLGGLVELTDDEKLFLQNISSLSYAEGDILYYDGSNITRLPIGTAGQILQVNTGATAPEWAAGGGGVSGPVSSTDNAITRWDGTGGDTLQNSGITIDDSDNLSGVNNVTGADTNLVTGTAGTNGNLVQWNTDGDVVDASVAASDVVTPSSTDTFTNKTFDANGTGNSISNIEVADLAGSAVVTEAEGIGSNDNDTTLPTSAAVKDYADSLGGLGGSTGATDNAVLRADGTGGSTVQASGITISDTDVLSNITQLNVDNLRLDGNTLSSTDTNGNINLTPNGTGQIIFPDGSESLPSIGFNGDTDTGFFLDAASVIDVVIGGDAKYRFNPSGFRSAVGGGFFLDPDAASLTSPVYAIQGDTDTGLGGDGAGIGSLIADGTSALQWDSNSVDAQVNLTVPNTTGNDTNFVTGTAGTNGNLIQWNTDGDAVDSSIASSDVTLNTDTDISTNSWVLDEDDLSSDDDTKVPTQQSVKAYVDGQGGNTETFTVAEDVTQGDAVGIATDNQATVLDSSTPDYWEITDANQTGLELTGDFTLEAWISNDGNTSNARIMGKRINAGNDGYVFDYRGSDGRFNLVVHDGTNGTNLTWTNDIGFDTWTHVAVTWDASAGNAELFVNGASQGVENGGARNAADTAASFTIGDDNGVDWNGSIDDVRLWDDIRTGTEISNNYQQELVGNESNLQGYWKLNGDATDETANGNDLTSSGSPTFTFITGFPTTGSNVVLASAVDEFLSNAFIGFAAENITSGNSGDIVLSSVAGGFTGLTPGEQYYLSDTAGEVSTSAGSNTRKVGIAVSATQMLITNIW